MSAAPDPTPGIGHAVVLITGIQAAGKSTVAQELADRLPRSVHVRGDVFRREETVDEILARAEAEAGV